MSYLYRFTLVSICLLFIPLMFNCQNTDNQFSQKTNYRLAKPPVSSKLQPLEVELKTTWSPFDSTQEMYFAHLLMDGFDKIEVNLDGHPLNEPKDFLFYRKHRNNATILLPQGLGNDKSQLNINYFFRFL